MVTNISPRAGLQNPAIHAYRIEKCQGLCGYKVLLFLITEVITEKIALKHSTTALVEILTVCAEPALDKP